MGIELLGRGGAALLFVAIIVALDVGRRVGLRRLAGDPEGARAAMETHLKRAKATLLDAAERMRADEEQARIA